MDYATIGNDAIAHGQANVIHDFYLNIDDDNNCNFNLHTYIAYMYNVPSQQVKYENVVGIPT